MFRALSTAALGMSAQQRSVDNIANNLANVGTTGFKRTTIAFQDCFMKIWFNRSRVIQMVKKIMLQNYKLVTELGQ